MRGIGACHDFPSLAHSTGHALRVKTAGSWPELSFERVEMLEASFT